MKIRQFFAIGTASFFVLLSGCANSTDVAPAQARSSIGRVRAADFEAAAEKIVTGLNSSQSFQTYLRNYAESNRKRSGTGRERWEATRPLAFFSEMKNLSSEHRDFTLFIQKLQSMMIQSGKVRFNEPERVSPGDTAAERKNGKQKRTVMHRQIAIPDLSFNGVFLKRKLAPRQSSYMMIVYLTDTRTGNLICVETADIPQNDRESAKNPSSAEGICEFLSANLIQDLFNSPNFASYCQDFAEKTGKGMTQKKMLDQAPVVMFSGIDNRTGEHAGMFDVAVARILQVLTASGRVRISAVQGNGPHIDSSIWKIRDMSRMQRRSSRNRLKGGRDRLAAADLSLGGFLTKKVSKQTGVSYILTMSLTECDSGYVVWASTQELKLKK